MGRGGCSFGDKAKNIQVIFFMVTLLACRAFWVARERYVGKKNQSRTLHWSAPDISTRTPRGFHRLQYGSPSPEESLPRIVLLCSDARLATFKWVRGLRGLSRLFHLDGHSSCELHAVSYHLQEKVENNSLSPIDDKTIGARQTTMRDYEAGASCRSLLVFQLALLPQ